MEEEFVIGVDIGTQGTKTVLCDVLGNCRATAFKASKLHRPKSGVVEEDPEDQLSAVCATVSRCMRDAGVAKSAVAGLAIDGQMAGVIGIGRDGRAVTPYDSWLDTRCAPFITKMREAAGEAIIRKTGGPVSFNHGPKILWWQSTRKSIFRRIRSFVQPSGYAAMRLCGLGAEKAFIDTTYLHFSGFADNRRAAWDEELCARFDVDPAQLPQIVPPYAIVGQLDAGMARRCGLRVGTPVAAGCGDSAAGFLACGATRKGICVDVAGTASVFSATTDQFCPDVGQGILSYGQSVMPGLWHPYAYINGGGMNLEWFREQFGGGESFQQLDQAAAKITQDQELPLFVPHLGGRVSPAQPGMRGAWAGLDWSHSKGHLYRAVLEGVALEYCIYRDTLKTLEPRFKMAELRVTGGGERSALWNQIKANALECPIVTIQGGEGAPMGAALLAAHAVGLCPDLDASAQAWAQRGKVTQPERKHRKYFQARRQRYNDLLSHLNIWSHL